MGYIYKITNDVNGKMYIGKTEHEKPEKRWKQHLRDYKKEFTSVRPLYLAMKKYGEEHFAFEVIEKTDDTTRREQYWIKNLHTYIGFEDCNGYNASLGGEGSSLNLNKNEVIEYHIYKANCLASDTANHFKVSDSYIKSFLEDNNIPYLKNDALKRFNVYVEYGGVYQIDPKTKHITNIFENAEEADMYLGVCKKINTICKYNAEKSCIKHYFLGYLWFYGKDYNKYMNQILEFDIDNYINKYTNYDFDLIYQDLLKTRNITETIYNLNINFKSESYIRRKLKELGYDLNMLQRSSTYIVQRDKYTKAIINIFHSIREANIYLGKPIDSRNISSCLQGKTKTAYGFVWEYLN